METPLKLLVFILVILVAAVILMALITGWGTEGKSLLEDLFKQLSGFV